MPRGNTEPVVQPVIDIDPDRACRHVMRRFIPAPASRVIQAFRLHGLHASRTVHQLTAPNGSPDHTPAGTWRIVEAQGGHPTRVEIRITAWGHAGAAVRITLQVEPTTGITMLYHLGLDDLWESRLNAITDLAVPKRSRWNAGPGAEPDA